MRIVLALALVLIGCSPKPVAAPEPNVAGVYDGGGMGLDIRSDGSCIYADLRHTWAYSNGVVRVYHGGDLAGTFKLEGKDLIRAESGMRYSKIR